MCAYSQTAGKLLLDAPANLIRSAKSARVASSTGALRVHRTRYVQVEQKVLLEPSIGPRRIALDLFGDTQFQVEEQQSYWTKEGDTFVWVGKIDGMARGHVTLAATGDIVSANVTTDEGRFYWIRQAEGRLHTVQEVSVT